jgi:CxxC motif-containing protein (DUF1111 family)
MLGGILSKTIKLVSVLTLAVLCFAGMAFAQAVDAGVQGTKARCNTVNNVTTCTGDAFASVKNNDNPGILSFFQDGQTRFAAVDTTTSGLGPRFNSNSCVSCHAFPSSGGSGPATNPQAAFAGSSVAPKDTTPSFITSSGPTREARFPFFFNANGTANTNAPNGGVETIFTVTGSSGSGSCSLQQPGFAAAAQANNIIFRIPTPVYGSGLIENIDDSTLLIALASTNANNNVGVSGTFNHSGNDGTITRFGWKAQNKSLHIFSGEAYNVEMGISNLLFPQDRPLPGEDGNGTSGAGNSGLPSACLNLAGNGYPEDSNNPGQTSAAAVLDDVSAFADFMRTLAPPQTGSVVLKGTTVAASSISNGSSLFKSVGCSVCHTPTVGTSQPSNITGGLSSQPVTAFSDIALHHMGSGLADNVGQGGAGGDQFRTAPLWGLGQRIFFLHDGRTTDLLAAIDAHSSNGSEANTVEQNFDNLSTSQQQDLLNFLRSL